MAENMNALDIKPELITLTETYTYIGELSSNDYIHQYNEPTGKISLKFKFDNNDFSQSSGTGKSIAGLKGKRVEKPVSAAAGRLCFKNYQETDIDKSPDLKRQGDKGYIDLKIPIQDKPLEGKGSKFPSRLNCNLESTYSPYPPESHPVNIKAEIVNLYAYHNQQDLDELDSMSDHASMSEIIRNSNEWDAPFAIKVAINIILPDRVQKIRPEKLSIDAYMALEWEVNQSANDVEFYKRSDNKKINAEAQSGNKQNIDDHEPRNYKKDISKLVQIPSYFIPMDGVVEGKLSLKEVGGRWEDGIEAMVYELPEVFLKVRRPSLLFNKKERQFSVTIVIDNELLSGMKVEYLTGKGAGKRKNNENKADLTSVSQSVIELKQRLQLTDYFEGRDFVLFEKLFFSGLILGDDEIAQIRNEFDERGFIGLKTFDLTDLLYNLSDGKESGRSIFIIMGEKIVGADTLSVWVVLDGKIKQIERIFMDDGIQHKSRTHAGDTQIFIRASLRREQVELIKIINEIVERLKDLFRHLEVQR